MFADFIANVFSLPKTLSAMAQGREHLNEVLFNAHVV